VPVYQVFTNAQLAEIVQKKVSSKTALADIGGVGEARIEKYAEPMLAVCREFMEAREK